MSRQTGFTLLELLVVMVLMALLSGLVGPRLYEHMQQRQRQAEQDEVLAGLAALRQRIQSNGWALVLDQASLEKELPDGKPPLELPEGWTVRIAAPIRFAFNGVCSGGSLEFRRPDGAVLKAVLKEPACWLDLSGGN